jgi:hypothetical protein
MTLPRTSIDFLDGEKFIEKEIQAFNLLPRIEDATMLKVLSHDEVIRNAASGR